MNAAVLELSDVVKDYRGLRPLRIRTLTIRAAEAVALVGLDLTAAEVLVNLITGATLPDSGEVRAFGRATSAIGDTEEWLALVDRFGIVSARAVLLEPLSVIQNLSMPFTLDIEPPPDDIRRRAEGLAAEVGLPEASWTRPVLELGPTDHVRVRLGRALALDPAVLLIEHPSAAVAPADVGRLGGDIRAIAERRGAATITATMDLHLAAAVAPLALVHEPATGGFARRGGTGWFGRRLG